MELDGYVPILSQPPPRAWRRHKKPRQSGALRPYAFHDYFPPLAGPLLLLVPGPTLPWPEGFADIDLSDFMLAPVVADEWCLLCLCDAASAAKVELTSPATARALIKTLVFIMGSPVG
jgi:hypothetical protein